MSHLKGWRRFAPMIALGVVMGAGIAGVPAAAANQATPDAVKIGDFSVPYTRNWQVRSSKLGRCVSFTATGKITYTVSREGVRPPLFSWTNQKINSPALKATVLRTDGNGNCVGSASLGMLRMGQHWTGFSCSFNPSISLSAPWGIGISGWPTCGTRNQATRSFPFGAGSTHTLFDSGAPVAYGTFRAGALTQYPCYGVYVSTKLTTSGPNADTDTFNTNPREVCLTKS